MAPKLHAYECIMSVPMEDIALELRGHFPIPWLDFLMNPRKLRGSDFLMRWSQGRWSEDRIVEAINVTGKYQALPYGLSSVAPDDPRKFEQYWEELEAAGLGKLKRPDLLVFRTRDEQRVSQLVQQLGGLERLPFTKEDRNYSA